MVKNIAYLLFPLLILSVSNTNAAHREWHVLYAEPDLYCVDKSVCTNKKCKKQANKYAKKKGLPNCSGGQITTEWLTLYAEPDSYCVDLTVCEGKKGKKRKKCKKKAKKYAAQSGLLLCSEIEEPPIEEPPICVDPEVLDTETNTCVTKPEDIVEPTPPGDKTTYTIVVNDKSYYVELIPPNENIDGSTVTEISKYVIYIGDTPDTNNFSFKVDLNTSGSTLINLIPEMVYYMSIVAVDGDGYESDFSNIIVLD